MVVTHRPWAVGAQAAKLEARIGVELLRTEQRLTKPSAGDRFLVGFPFSRGFCYSGPVGTSLEPHIHSQRSSSVVELLWSSICDETRRRRLFRGHNTFLKGFLLLWFYWNQFGTFNLFRNACRAVATRGQRLRRSFSVSRSFQAIFYYMFPSEPVWYRYGWLVIAFRSVPYLCTLYLVFCKNIATGVCFLLFSLFC